jgi:hypothetical protein
MANSIFGEIAKPPGVDKYGDLAVIDFASNILRFATVIAGVWVLINFISAGWLYIASDGKADAHQQVSQKMLQSVMGLAIIVGAYAIAGIVGLIFFGDATYIINPQVIGVGNI